MLILVAMEFLFLELRMWIVLELESSRIRGCVVRLLELFLLSVY